MKSGFLLLPALLAVAASAGSLWEQSIARVLERRFPEEETSYLLLDARSGAVLASRWREPDEPVPMGSLVKPFLALAYGGAHAFDYPRLVCAGEAGGCWLPRGHGRIGLEQAVAHSCNAYFRALAADLRPEDVSPWASRFGISPPQDEAVRPALIGLAHGWKVAPLAMARAYGELAARSGEPGALELLRGMALAAQSGTGRGVGRALGAGLALAKTGTAPCLHGLKGVGDGYVVALYPAASPRFALLVQVHGVPGMEAAAVGGRMLRVVLDGK